jgi:hypothetical protein
MLSVIEVPPANVAEPVVPTVTLIPAGLEFTRSPLLPVAVTVSVADCGGVVVCGFTVNIAVLVAPAKVPLIVTAVAAVTPVVPIAKFALSAPAGTVTFAVTLATVVLLLDSVTIAPPVGAAAVNVTVPCDELPPTTDVGLTLTLDKLAMAGAVCGVKLREADQLPVTPAEFLARTRHQCRAVARLVTVVCVPVEVRLRTSGALNVLLSST